MAPAIEIEGVSKRFKVSQERYSSLKERVIHLGRRKPAQHFWALRDFGFEVAEGETIGLLGHNGSGKSTLLKCIGGILQPTSGEIRTRGRLASLLELGAGFHPDLTGRENVFLQGAIMGMKTPEIRERFDEIVAFSGVEDFIDTPVKRYSNGMNARLGFAIAAHLNPDILVVDEVLSVGDYAFQEKAFGRVRTLAQSGIPVVVVSHQLDRIIELCTEAIFLQRGAVALHGDPAECVAAYVSGSMSTAPAASDCPVAIRSVTASPGSRAPSGEWIRLRIEGEVAGPIPDTLEPVGVKVRALSTGELVFATSTTRLDVQLPQSGAFGLDLSVQLNLPAGNYVVETTTWDPRHNRDAAMGPALRIEVLEGASFWGQVQMNPRMELVPVSDLYAISADGRHAG
jgi:ABC-type polysaccharide/polyol phosphate transport system ATPase subunit